MTALTITEQVGYLNFQNLTFSDAGGYLDPQYALEATTYSSTYKYNRGIAFTWPIADALTMPTMNDVLTYLQGQAIYGAVSWSYSTLNYYMGLSSWPNLTFVSGSSGSGSTGSPTVYVSTSIYDIGVTSGIASGYEVRGAIVTSYNYSGAPAEADPNKAGMFSHASLAPAPPAPYVRTRAIGGNLRLRQRQTPYIRK